MKIFQLSNLNIYWTGLLDFDIRNLRFFGKNRPFNPYPDKKAPNLLQRGAKENRCEIFKKIGPRAQLE